MRSIPLFALLLVLAALSGCETSSSTLTDASIPTTRVDGAIVEARDAGAPCPSEPCLRWSDGPELPSARSEHAGAVLDIGGAPHLVIAGGGDYDIYNMASPMRDVVSARIEADGSLGTWQTLTALPGPSAYHQVIAANGALWMLGGFGARAYNQVVTRGAMSGDALMWEVTAAPRTGVRIGAVALPITVAGTTHALWIGGLTESGAVLDVAVLDPVGGTMSAMAPLPGARGFAAATWHDGRVYVVGGIDAMGNGQAPVLRSRHEGETIVGWDVVGTFEGAPYGHGVWAHDGYLFTMGGFRRMTVSREVWRAPIQADGTLGTFEPAGEPMPIALTEGAFIAHGDVLYAVGGRSRTQLRSQSRVLIGRFE